MVIGIYKLREDGCKKVDLPQHYGAYLVDRVKDCRFKVKPISDHELGAGILSGIEYRSTFLS